MTPTSQEHPMDSQPDTAGKVGQDYARLREFLAEYDEAVEVCPIRRNDPRATAAERCPVCMATSSQGCGREASASYALIKKLREALERWPCGSCGGSGRYLNRSAERGAEDVMCKVCAGHGLHPIAQEALNSIQTTGDHHAR